MAILSDSKILKEIKRGNIIIVPFYKECLGSNSYDVHLGKVIGVYDQYKTLDAKENNLIVLFDIPKTGFVLEPNKFYLASTVEYTKTKKFVPFLEGKSSTGRLGISIHETAGKGDVGFNGYWTLEIRVGQKVKVYPNMPIGQIMYHTIEGKVLNPYDKKYNSKYSNQKEEPTPSMMWKNFGKDPLWK